MTSMNRLGLGTPAFRHPCDVAVGLLLRPLPVTNTTLHLTLSLDRFQGDQLALGRNYPTINWESYRTDLNGQCRVETGCFPEDPLPEVHGIYDLVSISGTSPLRIASRELFKLFLDIRRILKDDGEILVISGEDLAPIDAHLADSESDESTRSSVTHNDPSLAIRTAKAEGRSGVSPEKRSNRLTQASRLVHCAFQRTWRHAIARALKRAGFAHADWFVLARDGAGCLTRIQPLKSHYRWAGTRFNLRRYLRLKTANEFAVRASASTLQAPLIEQCLQSTQVAARSHSFELQTLMVTPKEKAVVIAALDDRRAVLRIPLSAAGRHASEQNARALQHLGTLPQLRDLVPRLIHQVDMDEIFFTAESFVDGTPLRHLHQGPQALQEVEALLHSINPRQDLQRRRIEESDFDELIAKPLAAILPLVRTQGDRAWLEQYLIDSFQGKEATFGISHGDLSASNIYVKLGDVVGVIDWDEASLQGIPVLDAVSHLVSLQGHRGEGLADTFSRLLTKQWPQQAELDFLARCYEYFGAKPDEHQSLVLLYWLQVVGNQAEFWYFANPEFSRNQVDQIVALTRRICSSR